MCYTMYYDKQSIKKHYIIHLLCIRVYAFIQRMCGLLCVFLRCQNFVYFLFLIFLFYLILLDYSNKKLLLAEKNPVFIKFKTIERKKFNYLYSKIT
jgi:hypothetical protein